MTKKKIVTFTKSNKAREELQLPILHYIVADDWIDKLGMNAFKAWLKFHTWVDRSASKNPSLENDCIPTSLEAVAERLGMSKATFYKTVIHVLWEYGLIDLIEFENSTRKTQKPINIIPYDYPQGKIALATKPLEKCRNWKTDYDTKAAFYGKKGGRKPGKAINDNRLKNKTVQKNVDSYRLKFKTVKKSELDRLKNKTVDRLENKTVTVLKIKPNNVSNISNNVSNPSSNDSINQSIEKLKVSDTIKQLLKGYSDRLTDDILKSVEELYLSKIVAEGLFCIKLAQTLKHGKNIVNYFTKILENEAVKHPASATSGIIREEIVPENLTGENYQQEEMSEEEKNEIAALEKRLREKYKKNTSSAN